MALQRSSEIAKELGITKNKLIEMANNGEIPCYKLPSGHYRFDVDDVKEALKVSAKNTDQE